MYEVGLRSDAYILIRIGWWIPQTIPEAQNLSRHKVHFYISYEIISTVDIKVHKNLKYVC